MTFIRELDTSPSFNGTNLMAGPGSGPFVAQIPMGTLQDCTTYYWRAKAVIQNDTSPWSKTSSFETNFFSFCGSNVQSIPFEPQKEVYCRELPSESAAIVRMLMPAMSYSARGRSMDGMYTLLNDCFVMNEYGELGGNYDDLPEAVPPSPIGHPRFMLTQDAKCYLNDSGAGNENGQNGYTLPAGESFVVYGRDLSGMYLYVAGCFVDIMYGQLTGELYQINLLPTMELMMPPRIMPPSIMPTFDTDMFYYGGACTPQSVTVKIMVDVENLFNVLLFYRLEMDGVKTA